MRIACGSEAAGRVTSPPTSALLLCSNVAACAFLQTIVFTFSAAVTGLWHHIGNAEIFVPRHRARNSIFT